MLNIMKALCQIFSSLCLMVVVAVCVVSCGHPEDANEEIIPDHTGIDMRKPAVPADEQTNYPLYPQVRERGPEAVIRQDNPAESGMLEEVVAVAAKNASAILEGIMKQAGDGEVSAGSEVVKSYGPEILEAILNSDGEIPQEVVDGASAVIAEHAPAIIEGIISQQEEESDSATSAIAGMIFRKILESATSE